MKHVYNFVFSLGGLFGIGCGFNYHNGVSMLNLLVVPKRNAMSNGFSLAGNTAGAICVIFLISNLLQSSGGYERTMFILSYAGPVCLIIATSFYFIPLRHISKYADEACKAQTTGKILLNT
jgi:hypothetical protein